MLTLSDGDLVRAFAYISMIFLAGAGTVSWWAVRIIVSRIGRLENRLTNEMRGFDRRITRIEAKLNLPTPLTVADVESGE